MTIPTIIDKWRVFSLITESPNSPGYIFPRDLLFQVLESLFEIEYNRYKKSKSPIFRIVEVDKLYLLRYINKRHKSALLEQHSKKNLIAIAAQNGHFNTLIYLHKEAGLIGDDTAIFNAALWGRFEILTYLHEEMGLVITNNNNLNDLVYNLVIDGYLNCIIYLHEKMRLVCGNKIMKIAAEYGRVDIIQYLHDKMGLVIHPIHMLIASEHDKTEAFDYFNSVLQN